MKTRTTAIYSIAVPLALMALLLTSTAASVSSRDNSTTATPIQHVVVIFDENVSFDHYFGTYPDATNPPNEPPFTPAPGTPTVTGLTGSLLTDNPNYLVTGNPDDNPQLLSRSDPVTCDNDHDYTAEQAAFNGGLMNMFPEQTSCSDGLVMDYYDGNTVTALWNYAQNFALNDNSFGTTFGPSTPGALNLVSGIGGTAVVTYTNGTTTSNVPGVLANGQLIGDIDPTYDDCSYTTDGSTSTAAMTPTSGSGAPQNIGDLLNDAGITWGWFQGGFAPTIPYNATSGQLAVCGASNVQVGGTTETDYSPHHDPFQYFLSTANPHHLPPSSPSMIGYTDQANHQYDLSDFWIAADSGNLPAVSFLKADRYQDGHPGNSDPLDEQAWLVNTINQLESLPTWSSTAIIIDWDDSDGWYDQVMPPIVNPSSDPVNDVLNGNTCGMGTSPLGVEDRCGYGPRIPMLVISPYSKTNFVDNTLTDQTSILKFIEQNWYLGSIGPTSFDNLAGTLDNMFNFNQPANNKLILDPQTGEPVNTKDGQIGLVSGGATPRTCTDQSTNPDVCAIQSTIENTPISSGSYVWFSSEMSLDSQVPSTGLTVHYSGQWIYVQLKDGATLQVAAPNAEVVYSPTATTETTTFTGGQWVTTVPANFQGTVFLSGLAYQVPNGVDLQGAKVTWTGAFSGTTNSFQVDWQWGASAFSSFGSLSLSNTNALYNGLGVQPTSQGQGHNQGVLAGTPNNFTANQINGGTKKLSDSGTAYYQAYLLNQ